MELFSFVVEDLKVKLAMSRTWRDIQLSLFHNTHRRIYYLMKSNQVHMFTYPSRKAILQISRNMPFSRVNGCVLNLLNDAERTIKPARYPE